MLSISPSTLAWRATPVFIFGHSGYLIPVPALCGMCARRSSTISLIVWTMKLIYSKPEGLKSECASEALEKFVKTQTTGPQPQNF